MKRNDEFLALKEELERTPVELEFTVTKAINRAKKQKRWSMIWKTPVVSFCSMLILFVLLVNLFPKVALAMSNVPILKNLVLAVSFDPSLKLAVENDYYQPIGDSQTQNDVTVTVECMILDAAHISLFFSVDAPVETGLYHFELLDGEGKPLVACIGNDTMYEVGKLEEITIEFGDRNVTVPEHMTFQITVNQDDQFTQFVTVEEPSTVSDGIPIEVMQPKCIDYNFTFFLTPDQTFAKTVNSIPLNQWIEIQGQRIYLDCLNIYPTRTRLYLDCDENNSAVVSDLGIYFKDENGDIYDNRTNDIVAQGSPDSFDIGAIYFESSYFTDAKKLTMYITDITLIDKAKMYGTIDLTNKTITNMPKGVSVSKMELDHNTLSFTIKQQYEISNPVVYQVIDSNYYDLDGNTYNFGSWTTGFLENENVNNNNFHIDNFEANKFKVRWIYSPSQALEEPIVININ